MVEGPAAGLSALDALAGDAVLARSHRLAAARGHLYERQGDRIAAAEEEEDEEELPPEPEDRGDGTGRVAPKRPGEFVCQSCFLVKHPTQMADAKRKLCADCV